MIALSRCSCSSSRLIRAKLMKVDRRAARLPMGRVKDIADVHANQLKTTLRRWQVVDQEQFFAGEVIPGAGIPVTLA